MLSEGMRIKEQGDLSSSPTAIKTGKKHSFMISTLIPEACNFSLKRSKSPDDGDYDMFPTVTKRNKPPSDTSSSESFQTEQIYEQQQGQNDVVVPNLIQTNLTALHSFVYYATCMHYVLNNYYKSNCWPDITELPPQPSMTPTIQQPVSPLPPPWTQQQTPVITSMNNNMLNRSNIINTPCCNQMDSEIQLGTCPQPLTTPSIQTNNEFHCDKCCKVYMTHTGLLRHKEILHGAVSPNNSEIKRFACKECSKTYTTMGALKMHIRTHTLPCKCEKCGKAFSRPWLLQGHLRTHTGEKPFKCEVCQRAFADRSNLRAHMQTHSDVKKYRCHQCQKSFSRMSLLSKHNENCIYRQAIRSSTE
ncbi:hypothetical protein GJ496_002844 [Pomphorhynchus laevis]|nr:hypothetical protein GJ496_002844 [Pomphorhynchus laevis]